MVRLGDGQQLQQTQQSLRSAWEGYKRTQQGQGMMCAAFSPGPAAQPDLSALAPVVAGAAVVVPAPAAAVGAAVLAEPAGSLLPAVGCAARHLGNADAMALSTAHHQSREVCLPRPSGTSQAAWQPYHWAEPLHLEDLWPASPPLNVWLAAPDGSLAVQRPHWTIVPPPAS